MSLSRHSHLDPLLRKLAFWRDFDAADEQALLALPHHAKTLDRHSYLVHDGEPTTHCCVMLSGFAMRHKIVGDGSRQILALHMKGDAVDLQNSLLRVADHSVQLLTNAEIAFIPRAEIRQLALERPNIGMAMWLDTLVDASIFREWIANVGRRDAHTRIAHLLCEFAVRLKVAGLGHATDYELPMTQEQIADCVGLTPVHVNRTLKTLEHERLITRHSSRTVIVGDWNKLAKAGDFDTAYLHLRANEASLA
jgi:CRP-like cAMP-binding protein